MKSRLATDGSRMSAHPQQFAYRQSFPAYAPDGRSLAFSRQAHCSLPAPLLFRHRPAERFRKQDGTPNGKASSPGMPRTTATESAVNAPVKSGNTSFME